MFGGCLLCTWMLTGLNCLVIGVALHGCIGCFTKQYTVGLGISASTILPNFGMFVELDS